MPRKDAKRISGACFVKVENLVELGRLTCALERAPFPVFAFKNTTGVRIASQVDLFMGTPIFYYTDAERDGEFLAYRNTGEVEEVQLVDSATNPTYIYGPIIRVKKLPTALEAKEDFGDKYMAVEVTDVSSLVKVGAYKMLFEEPPLPIFTFKRGSGWVLGTFARIDDYEEASLFFYTRLEEEPKAGFMKYSPSKTSETSFSRRTEEHGFAYIKVIKLAENHPLVEF